MPFLRSATRPQAVQCFFCLSPSLLPPRAESDQWQADPKGKGKGRVAEPGTRWNWHCKRCGCWNVKDEHGEMISDLPAMHNQSMNTHSYSLRAKPSSSRLPSSSSSSSPFCHSCQANQTLIMNMLANYLPDDTDPFFPSMYAQLPAYLSNLHSRYPPVCALCQPAVDEVLRKADHRAQVEAWGSALKRGAVTSNTDARNTEGSASGRVSGADIFIWRLRGGLFWLSLATSWGQGVLATAGPVTLHQALQRSLLNTPPISMSSGLVIFHFFSILWIAWDPYWLRRTRARDRTKVRGRETWVRNMLLNMGMRVLASISLWLQGAMEDGVVTPATHLARIAFALEVAMNGVQLVIHSLLSIRISQPVAIQLVRPVPLSQTSSPARAASSMPQHPSTDGPGISALALGSRQPIRSTNPIFGQPSLQQFHVPSLANESGNGQAEPMDWEPSPSAVLANGGWTNRPPPDSWTPEDEDVTNGQIYNWDNFATNKQRMFPRQPGGDETGLESLLAGWGIGGGGGGGGAYSEGNTGSATQSQGRSKPTISDHAEHMRMVRLALVALAVFRLVGLGLANMVGSRMIELANRTLLLLELLTTIGQLAVIVRSNRTVSSAKTNPANLLPVGIVAMVQIVIRAITLSPFAPATHSPILSRLELDDAQTTFIEWLMWSLSDAVSAAVVY